MFVLQEIKLSYKFCQSYKDDVSSVIITMDFLVLVILKLIGGFCGLEGKLQNIVSNFFFYFISCLG